MSFWAILKNIGIIIQFFKTLQSIISSSVKSKSIPSKIDIIALLDSIEDLLDRGVIDVPGVDEKAISDALKQIEDHLNAK